jgi:phasin family protein
VLHTAASAGDGRWKCYAAGRKRYLMLKNIEDFQKLGKDNVDVAMKQLGTVSKGWQTLASETAGFSKQSLEDGAAHVEKLFGAKSLDKAMEIQTDYAKTAYEGFVAQATKMGELYADLAKETYKPFESYMAKATPVK